MVTQAQGLAPDGGAAVAPWALGGPPTDAAQTVVPATPAVTAEDLAALLRDRPRYRQLRNKVQWGTPHITFTADEAADAIQEAYCRALAALDQVTLDPRTADPLLTWLARKAMVAAGDAVRGRQRSLHAAEGSAYLDGLPAAPVDPRLDDLDDLDAALAGLAPAERELLAEVTGASDVELEAVAAATGRTVRALRKGIEKPLAEVTRALGATGTSPARAAATITGKSAGRPGEVYGTLILESTIPKAERRGSADWTARCACGRLVPVALRNLRSGATTTCGAYTCRSTRNRSLRGLPAQTPGPASSTIVRAFVVLPTAEDSDTAKN